MTTGVPVGLLCREHYQQQLHELQREAAERLEATEAELRVARQQHAEEVSTLQQEHSLQLAVAQASSAVDGAAAADAQQVRASLEAEHQALVRQIEAQHNCQLQLMQQEVERLRAQLLADQAVYQEAQAADVLHQQQRNVEEGRPQGPPASERRDDAGIDAYHAGGSADVESAREAFAARMQVLEEDQATKADQASCCPQLSFLPVTGAAGWCQRASTGIA